MSVLGLKSGYTAKYDLSPEGLPSGNPSGSGHIFPYIPPLVLIRIQCALIQPLVFLENLMYNILDFETFFQKFTWLRQKFAFFIMTNFEMKKVEAIFNKTTTWGKEIRHSVFICFISQHICKLTTVHKSKENITCQIISISRRFWLFCCSLYWRQE